jgi:hypothetical protein
MLDFEEPRIEAAGGQELVVGAMLHELMVFHHENRVGVEDGSQVVRDDDRRLVLHQTLERFHDRALGLRVEA